jgi:hypothetical protein
MSRAKTPAAMTTTTTTTTTTLLLDQIAGTGAAMRTLIVACTTRITLIGMMFLALRRDNATR